MAEYNRQHWETIFTDKHETEYSWFEEYPQTSVDFLDQFAPPLDANIVDVGGGDSHMVDILVDRGYRNVWVVDISEHALERAKQRLGAKAQLVRWVVSDILDFYVDVQFDFWHDRAAFHFQTNELSINKYVHVAAQSIKHSGALIVGTFSESGPMKCSGLEVHRYSQESMVHRFDHYFNKVKCIEKKHETPFHTTQDFVFCSFKRK